MIVYLEVNLQDGSPLTYQERMAHALEGHARWLRTHDAEPLGQMEPNVHGTILCWDTDPDVSDRLLCHDHDYLVVSEEDAASLRDLLKSLEDALIKTEEPWLPSAT